jgi:UTP-glucose-1-phosphate uridylyltransferase
MTAHAVTERRKAMQWLSRYRREMQIKRVNQHWLDGMGEAVLHLKERVAKLKRDARGARR